MATERELKYSTSDDHVPSATELNLALSGSGMSVTPIRVDRHVDTYYDSSGRLAAAGAALRRRRSPGILRTTYKGPAVVTGALHQREEIEVVRSGASDPAAPGEGDGAAAAAQDWPQEVARALPADVLLGDLAPVATLRVRRVVYLVVDERALGRGTLPPADGAAGELLGQPLAELSFDEVECDAAGTVVTFHEVEIELAPTSSESDASARAERLEAVSAAVATLVDLTPSSASKLARAQALVAAILGA